MCQSSLQIKLLRRNDAAWLVLSRFKFRPPSLFRLIPSGFLSRVAKPPGDARLVRWKESQGRGCSECDGALGWSSVSQRLDLFGGSSRWASRSVVSVRCRSSRRAKVSLWFFVGSPTSSFWPLVVRTSSALICLLYLVLAAAILGLFGGTREQEVGERLRRCLLRSKNSVSAIGVISVAL